MNKRLNKLFSATLVLMMVLSQSSNLIATLHASSEYLSEASDVASSEVVSEELDNELQESEVQEISTVSEVEQENKSVSIEKETTQKQVVTEKQTRVFTDMSGVGNQNKSTIGLGTYIHPNEETEKKLKNINEMQNIDSTTYVAVSDLNASLVEAASAGEYLSEGVISGQFPSTMSTDEVNSHIAKNLTFKGSCWTPSEKNMLNIPNDGNIMNIKSKVVDSDTCSLLFTDFGYYYNIETFEYKPVDMILDIKYVDFYTSPNELASARLGIGIFDGWGLFFETFQVDEFEYSFDYKLKDGTLVDVPILYEHSDFDLSLSMGFNKEDLHKLVTFYQDPVTSKYGQYTEPWVASANEEFAGKYVNGDQFNFKSYYDYVEKNYNNGKITASDIPYYTRYFKKDRSFLNAITSINNASGEATPTDRGWNRLKVLENDNNVVMFESWGVNTASNGVTEMNKLANFTSSGKDGRFAVVMDSSSTMTLNQNSAYFGYDPTENAGYSQGSGINPYKNTDTIITKNMSDANSNKVAEIGEELTYSIQLDNVLDIDAVLGVPVRDSLLEDLPEYLTWDGSITVKDSKGNNVAYTGDIAKGTLVVSSVAPHDKVVITYKLKLNKYVEGLNKILNVAVNKNVEPKEHCTPETTSIYCGATEIPVEGTTVIKKMATDSDGSGKVSPGEKVTYQIDVTNNTNETAYDVNVRDNKLETIPSYVTFNDDIEISGATSTGSLLDGTLNFAQIDAGVTVTITYSFTFADELKDITSITNVVTDNGEDPTTVNPDTCDETDCDEATTEVLPADTTIKKSVVDEDGNGLVAVGETLTYTIEVLNSTENHAYDVVIRDSMLENLPSYLTFNEDVTIVGSEYTGNLNEGSLVLDKAVKAQNKVIITYSITVNDMPKGVTNVSNIATDNGEDPTTVDPDPCDESDCGETTTEVEEADTTIKKSVADEDANSIAVVGEKLTYTIEVSNATGNHAYDVVVRDSMLEDLPTFVTYNQDAVISGSTFTGKLTDGSLVLDKVMAKDKVIITYSITVNDIPLSVTSLLNIATDNGEDPTTVNPDTCDETDCSETTTDAEPGDTTIKKSVADEDGLVTIGETLTYTIEISNATKSDALNVVVRDSMLENLPEFVTFNDDVTVNGSEYTGNLTDGSLVLANVPSKETVVITYSITYVDTPKDMNELLNIATDNGEDPTTENPDTCDETDCSSVTTEIEPGDTIIKKSVTDENGDALVSIGETLTYTIVVSNVTGNHAYDVAVRDDKLESIPDFVTFNDDVTVDGSEYTGNLTDGSLVLANVRSKETVVITYSFTYVDTPKDTNELLNIATDNGEDPTTENPDTCDETDCSSVTTEIEPGDTIIKKSVTDENGDALVSIGETLTYTIVVSNVTGNHAYDVVVRDDKLESIPDFVTFNDDVTVNGSEYTGNLTDGSLVLANVRSKETVVITYSFTYVDTPKDMNELLNIATDNGEDPSTVNPDTCDEADCTTATIEVEKADTVIEKSVVDASGDGKVEAGEKLTYSIKVSNTTGNHAYDVLVRDDMLESIPSFATFNQDVVISGTTYSGDLTKGTLVLETVKSNETVEIVYSLTVNELPTNITEVINVATDNGDDPSKIDSKDCNDSTDCASASISLIEVVIESIVETGNKVIAIVISSILVLAALLFVKRQVNRNL